MFSIRRIALLSLGLVFLVPACGDPGPRDRSLLARADRNELVAVPRRRKPRKGNPRASVIGLVPDHLANYYADDAEFVVRFSGLGTLGRKVAPRIRDIADAVPALAVPDGEPVDLLRTILGLAPEVIIDPVRPFALVKVESGWIGIIPTRSREPGDGRLKQIDALYCVAGEPEVVEAYQPGFRKGFYLPGDCSLILHPDDLRSLGTQLNELTRALDIDCSFLDGLVPGLPKDIERLDVALRLRYGEVRVDVRLAPGRESPTGHYLDRIKPSASHAARWLPAGGTAYLEFASPPVDFEGLLQNLLRDEIAESVDEQLLLSLRKCLAALGRDTAAMLDLDPDGSGRVLLVASLDDPKAAEAFFNSYDLGLLLRAIAGPDGRLEWKPDTFRHDFIPVGSITGYISRRRRMQWQGSGNVLLTTLSKLLRGPAVVYVAVVRDKLVIALGQKTRRATEELINFVRRGKPSGNEHTLTMDDHFPTRLAGATIDLAALFEGTRGAAPYWHPRGRDLREVTFDARVPVSIYVTAEGGALRMAVRAPPVLLAGAAARVYAVLSQSDD